MLDVTDLIIVDLLEHTGGEGIVDLREGCLPVLGKVEVGLLIGQAQGGKECGWGLDTSDGVPEEVAGSHISETSPPVLCPGLVEPKVPLLILDDSGEPLAKVGGGVWKPKQGQRHQLQRLQLVVCEGVEGLPRDILAHKAPRCRGWWNRCGGDQGQPAGPSGQTGHSQGVSRCLIGKRVW